MDKTLAEMAVDVLSTADGRAKTALARQHAATWRAARASGKPVEVGHARPPGGAHAPPQLVCRMRVPRAMWLRVAAPALFSPAHLRCSARQRPFRPAFCPSCPPSPGAHLRVYSAFTASKTASTWPGTLTLRHIWRTTPVASIKKVARSIPM